MNIHPYYTARAAELLKHMGADPDADPTPLAAWAQNANGDEIVFITCGGMIVARGHFSQGEPTVAYMNSNESLPGAGLEAGLAASMLTKHFNQLVAVVKRSYL